MKRKRIRQYLDKFLTSPQPNARVQIEMPNGEKLDIDVIQTCWKSRMIGDRDTHTHKFKRC